MMMNDEKHLIILILFSYYHYNYYKNIYVNIPNRQIC